MSGMVGMGATLAGLEGVVVPALEVFPLRGRHWRQPGNCAERHGYARAISGLLLESVDMIGGAKVCLPWNETDLRLNARLPITWSRYYSSALPLAGLLGLGWRSPWEITLERVEDQLIYTDEQGRRLPLPRLEPGSQIIVSAEQLHVACLSDGRMVVADIAPSYRVFGDFDDAGVARLKYIEAPGQQRVGCIWDEEGLLLRMRGTCGQELKMHYDGDRGRLVGIERVDGGPTEMLVRYAYDGNGQLITVSDRLGAVTRRYAYENGRMVQEIGALGNVTRYVWLGTKLAERKTCRGAHDRFVFNLGARSAEALDVYGKTAYWSHDAAGRVQTHVDFDARKHSFEYDQASWPSTVTLPDGRRVAMSHDRLGRVTQEVEPDGGVRSSIYAYATGELLSLRHDDGRLWLWQYDDRLRATLYQSPLDGTTHIEYSDSEQSSLMRSTDAHGRQTVQEFDARGELRRHTSPDGRSVEYRRDANGYVVAFSDGHKGWTTLEVDGFGRPVTMTRSDGSVVRLVWNAIGQLLTRADIDGLARHWQRDAYGCVMRATDEEGNVIEHAYDAHGRRIRTVGGNGCHHTYEWEPTNRLRLTTDADGVSRRYEYDGAGQVIRIISQAGAELRETHQAYDAKGRLISRDTLHAAYRYTYSSQGLLAKIEREASELGTSLGLENDELGFEYDDFGRLCAEHGANGTVRLGYGADGDLAVVILPRGQVVKMQRDAAGRVDLIGFGHSEELSGISAFQYDEAGRERLHSQGEQFFFTGHTALGMPEWWRAVTTKRNALDEMELNQELRWRSLDYSPIGRVAQIQDSHEGRSYYDYDRRGFLLRIVRDDLGPEYYTWDAAGNLLETPRIGWKPESRADHRLRRRRDWSYQYDAWGQVVERQGPADTLTLTWDAEGRLLAAQGRKFTTRYRYDALGRRLGKVVTSREQGGPLHATPSETRVDFCWVGEQLMQEITGQSVRTYLYRPAQDDDIDFAPLACVDQEINSDDTLKDGRIYHYQTDAAGTAIGLADEGAVPVWRGRYQGWGRLLAATEMLEQVRQPLRMAGQYEDEDTGLHYNGRRYYDPDMGRYLSPERATPAGESPYRYVADPVLESNPTGGVIAGNTQSKGPRRPRGALMRQAEDVGGDVGEPRIDCPELYGAGSARGAK